MSSANFTYQDAIDAARELVNDDAQRRWDDADVLSRILPRQLAQLKADRPDAFLGVLATVNLKPSATDACAFDDSCFNPFVEALVAAIEGTDDEAAAGAQAADGRSERARRAP